MKTFFLTLLALFAFVCSPVANAQTAPVGNVTQIKGIVKTTTQQTPYDITMSKGDPVYMGDTIATTENSLVTIKFKDNTELTLTGMNGVLTIDKYIYDANYTEQNEARFSILKGSFEFVSGLMKKKDNVRLDLDFGSIGIRGTHLYRTMKDEACWIYLEEGEIKVYNDGGSVDLAAGQGTKMKSKTFAPTNAETWTPEEISYVKDSVKLSE